MSLHRKIVWLFIGVAIVPMLVVGESLRRDALAAALRTSEEAVASDARSAARLLALEASSADALLSALASGVGLAGVPDSSRLAELLVGPVDDGHFESLSVRDSTDTSVASAGSGPDRATRCTSFGRSTLVRRDVSLGSGGLVLVGTYWMGRTLDATEREGLTVLGPEGGVLLAPSCEANPGELLAVVGPDEASGRFRLSGPGEARHGAFARVGSPPRGTAFAVATLPGASLMGVLRAYAVPLVLLAAATLFVSLIVRQWSDVLGDLTGAARAVGGGDLSPWLPPPRRDELGTLTLAFSEMTARLRDRMEQVDRSGRLAVIGKLASYLAHEIRNPLSAVKMNLQRLDRWARAGELPERCTEPIRVSIGEVDRLSTAVSNVLQLSRSHDQPPEEISVHELVREAGLLLDNEFATRGVSLRWELDAEADRIIGRPGQLKGVVLNLMLNALDAQPEGGELLIRSNLAPGPRSSEGPRVELSFRDCGPGVPSDVRDRIFEPFFTTKASGSGIGLAVASQAVRDHGGDIRLEELRSLGSGADFVVSLPLAAVAPDSDAPGAAPRLAPWMEISLPRGREGSLGPARPRDTTSDDEAPVDQS
ncbi:MAG: ATP-binding protein [Longimicrobiales bacterium]|nr:ATP-binding protein [Longimicrobiales bacterium]